MDELCGPGEVLEELKGAHDVESALALQLRFHRNTAFRESAHRTGVELDADDRGAFPPGLQQERSFCAPDLAQPASPQSAALLQDLDVRLSGLERREAVEPRSKSRGQLFIGVVVVVEGLEIALVGNIRKVGHAAVEASRNGEPIRAHTDPLPAVRPADRAGAVNQPIHAPGRNAAGEDVRRHRRECRDCVPSARHAGP